MADIALMWDSRLLFEKFFIEHGFDHQLIHPANMGSPFLPPFKMILIPTGFASNLQLFYEYNDTIIQLQRSLSDFFISWFNLFSPTFSGTPPTR